MHKPNKLFYGHYLLTFQIMGTNHTTLLTLLDYIEQYEGLSLHIDSVFHDLFH